MLTELINPFHLAIALGPLAAYLLLVGMLNLTSRPFVTTGTRDAAAMGIGISGLVLLGPMYLLLPSATVFQWGSSVWLLLAAFYGLLLALSVLLIRPRLVIYNIAVEQVRPLLAQVASTLDNESRWAGNCLVLPRLGVQLNVESSPAMRNVQLVSAGPIQSYEGWRKLEKALVTALRETKGERNPIGISLIFSGFFLIAIMTFWMAQDPAMIAQTVHEMFDFSEK